MIAGETPEGWYADPTVPHPAAERWWNGVQWTAHTRLSMPDDLHDRLEVPAPGDPARHTPVVPAATDQPGPAVPALPAPPVPRRSPEVPVTPYGVALADFGPRMTAFVLDLFIVAVIAWPLGRLLGAAFDGSSAVQDWLTGLTPLLVFWVYHWTTLSAHGATWGQRAVGVGVRPWQEHGRLTREQLAVRTAASSVCLVGALVPGIQSVGALAWLVIAGSAVLEGNNRRGMHETWSETCVVRTR